MDRWRQEGIISSSILQNASVTIIGAGSTGRVSALSLAMMGVGELILYDNDTVEPHNRPNQILCKKENEGGKKVTSLKENILEYVDSCRIITMEEHYNRHPLNRGIIICAADDMETRSMVFSQVKKDKPDYYIESRMGAELMIIYSVDPHTNSSWYKKTLYSNEESLELACTARAISYNAFVLGGLIVSQVKKILMKEEVAKEIIFDLVTLTLMVE